MKSIICTIGKLTIYFRDRVIGSSISHLMIYAQDVKCHGFLKIKGNVYVNNKGRISIGKNVWINSSPYQNPIGGGDRCYLIARDGAEIRIGENTKMSNCILYSICSICVGKNVFIGNGCKIYDSDFHSLNLSDRISEPETGIKSRKTEIQNNVFVGAHSIILKGVIIGENSVIGAGSVVTKSIPTNEVWAGNPAKFIRELNKSENSKSLEIVCN